MAKRNSAPRTGDKEVFIALRITKEQHDYLKNVSSAIGYTGNISEAIREIIDEHRVNEHIGDGHREKREMRHKIKTAARLVSQLNEILMQPEDDRFTHFADRNGKQICVGDTVADTCGTKHTVEILPAKSFFNGIENVPCVNGEQMTAETAREYIVVRSDSE